MLEERTYPITELREVFHTRDTQSIRRRLERYGVIHTCAGRGDQATITITEIQKPFKVFAITELGFDANTDFTKLLYFYYFFFNDEEFMAMPDEVKERRMWACGHPLARQTIANYIQRLERNNLINRDTQNHIYYFAHKGKQIMTDKETYCKAWREYWAVIGGGCESRSAIYGMKCNYGGVARKQARPEINGIYNDKIEAMLDYIQKEIDEDTEN